MNVTFLTAHEIQLPSSLLRKFAFGTPHLSFSNMATKTTKWVTLVALFVVLSNYSWAQRVLTGKVTDGIDPIVGATVTVRGSLGGTSTDSEGNFSLSTDVTSGELVIRILGFSSRTVPFSAESNLGTIVLTVSDSQSLEEVVVVGRGIIDIAEDRKTPIAVSTISRTEIQNKGVGNVEFPEIMKNTPSVFVANQASGFGDGQNFLRGFDQSNTAYLLNGQPINGMEDGNMYWSNWSSIADVANAIQVQRGLGSSKLAISSVGGTVNIVTKATDLKKGGSVRFMTGNDGYLKGTVGYNTGLQNKWGFSMMIDYWRADRKYAVGTQGEGQSYFFSVGYKPNDRHNFNFMVFGAPQKHGQNYSKALETTYWPDDASGGIAGQINTPGYDLTGIKGNHNYGHYNGEGLSLVTNFYHKPVANLNWDFDIDEKSSLSTVLYASLGRGGSTGSLGNGQNRLPSMYGSAYGPQGQLLWDNIAEYNADIADGISSGFNGTMLRASMNNHFWYGLVSNFNHETDVGLTFNVGADLRFYHGDHFRQIINKLGLDSRIENSPAHGGEFEITETFKADPWASLFNYAPVDQRVGYDDSEDINYQGLFGQVEYSSEDFSIFVQGSVSNQSYVKLNRWNYEGGEAKSDMETKFGYNIKGGASYTINEENTLFVNIGQYSRQPFLDNVFQQGTIDFTDPVVDNEEIFGLEAGYRFVIPNFTINLNGYYTAWKNRFLAYDAGNREVNGTVYTNVTYLLTGVTQLHKGLELDFQAQITPQWMLRGYGSLGDWQYDGDSPYRLRNDEDSQIIDSGNLGLSGVKVGNAAQTSFGFGTEYDILENLSVDANYNFYDRLYAQVEAEDVVGAALEGEIYAPERLDSFGVFDAGLTYTFRIGNQPIKFRGNVLNLFNTKYFGRKDGFGYYYGLGTTWNAGLTYSF
ncbi:Outer membrane receptor proteins, mostly Fe transport [Parapedobacter indicus]|uniref:Outer membrane receptor proteins, mostly Fe transport n=2 Tax=Parapedobacter indicus TaxID=1477437 RepID=A0A1I3R6W1_9SPHI|nr:outer membrane receptor protein involved in Fe transport [Parapedobacter indicus]SFJ42068.1 Outer membrane receptor proteins, mostly Fe transport [Parapedobacter indicus]